MIRQRRIISIGLLVGGWAFVLGIAIGPQPARGLDLGDTVVSLIKLFGIAYVVDRFAGDIDRAINTVLQQHEAAAEGATKVVPILRIARGGGGTAVGGAQVMGPATQVDKVQAVGELELNIAQFRGRALIPVTTRKDLTQSIKGVGGVGVSANIKFPL
jgi:hypothetical protein